MGVWDIKPWDNDGAADWFAEMFDETKLAQYVAKTLALDPDDYHEEIRAAASVLIFLGRTYIWPIEYIDEHLKLAVESMEQVLKLEIYQESDEFVAAIESEIDELKSRIPDDLTISEPPTTDSDKKWWQFWK